MIYVVVGRVGPGKVDFEETVQAQSKSEAVERWARTARECGYSPIVGSARARKGS